MFFVVARFIFFPYVVFIGGAIVFLFIVVSIPRLVGSAVAGVGLVVFACGVCCSGLCCSRARGGCVGWFMGSAASVVFAGDVWLGFVYVSLVGFGGRSHSEGAWSLVSFR